MLREVETPLFELRFSLSPGDHARATQRYILSRFSRTLREVGVCGLIVLPLLAWLLLTGTPGGPVVYMLVGVLLLLLLPILVVRFLWGRRIARLAAQTPMPATIVWRFGQDKVEIGDGTEFGVALWSQWIGFLDSGDYLLLFLAADQFQILPKRAFASEEQLAAFRNLLKAKFRAASRP